MSTTFCYFLLVGVAGFEPTTSCTQNKRTTRLCYTPFILVRIEGLEPPRRKAMVPKTIVSTISPYPHMVPLEGLEPPTH